MMNKGTAGADGDRVQELVKQVFRPHPSLSLASHLIRPSISPPVVQIRGHEVALAELNNLHPSRVSGTSSVLLVIFKKYKKKYLCSTQTISQGENIKKQLDQLLTNVSEVKLNLTWGDINLSGIKS